MKKLVAAAVVSLAAVAFADLKVGTVDMMSLVKNHPQYEANKTALQTLEKEYKGQLDALGKSLEEIQAEGQKKAEEYRNPMLAAGAKAKLEKDITAIQERFMKKQQELRAKAAENQEKLGEMEASLLKHQAADIKARIRRFADAQGYDLVIDAAAAIYAKGSLDVTDAILKDMKDNPKPVVDKEQNEGK